MKYNILFSSLIVFCTAFFNMVQAQTILQREIKWTGIETLRTDKNSKQVLAFQNAVYPTTNNLPYYWYACNVTEQNYNFEVKNEVFTPITDREKDLISLSDIHEKIEISTYLTYSEGKSYKNIQILPFIKKGDNIYKLNSFDLIKKNGNTPLKTPKRLSTTHTYTSNSVLKSGKFVKIKVVETGIYKLTFETIKSMGIDPNNVRIFGYGGALLEQDFTLPKIDDLPEVAIWIEKGSDGVFNSGDYILFYGQGIVKWKYDKEKKMFTHTLNHYANEGYYFITSDAGIGKRIEKKVINIPENTTINTITDFTDYFVHEKEIRNIGQTGKIFYGEEFWHTTTYKIPTTLTDIVPNTIVKTRLDVAAAAFQTSQFSLRLNNNENKSINIPAKKKGDYYELGKAENKILLFTTQSPDIIFDISYAKPDATAKGYLNYIEVNAVRKLTTNGKPFAFRSLQNINSDNYNKYIISGTTPNMQVWDITNPITPQSIEIKRDGNTIEFTDNNRNLKQYIAIDPTQKDAFTLEPIVVGEIPNQDLHSMGATDYVIITHPQFIPQAEKLAQVHREKNNLRVSVVTTEQVYNEFSSGTPDATAYRWLMKMLYDRALNNNNIADKPKYLLLFGRGSYDNRGIISGSGDNLIITYQADLSTHKIDSYVTDDYFGYLDDTEGTAIPSDLLDIGIGRFPVSNQEQADAVVNKTIAYINNTIKGKWKNQLVFVADDGDGGLHASQADNIATIIAKQKKGYQVNKLYLDAYPQEVSASDEKYPMVYTKLQNLIHSGVLMLNYTGHASQLGWSSEGVLKTDDIKNMYNKKLPLWIAATCDFLLFDVETISAGEQVILNPNGGGIGLLSAARTVYSPQNEQINRLFTTGLFNVKDGNHLRIGDILKEAKKGVGPQINKLSYMYFGDPAIKLNYPDDYEIVTTKLSDITTSKNDTLRALSVQNIEGYIADKNKNKITDFNGVLEITVYDKELLITTLNNDKNGAYKFVDRPHIIYSGKAKVINGDFNVQFMIPKDIKYNYGYGRINYYATDTIVGTEAQGYYENFIVGGSNPNATYETEGPTINIYLNTPNFTNGEKVNETPIFIANLFDENGINTAGSGIGHDLRLLIDNNPLTSYTLNEYFIGKTGSYKAGIIQFKIPQLTEGKHTLQFVAWDLLNNSSYATLDFEVVNGLKPTIINVKSYPNPAKSHASFIIEHDRPETVLEAQFDIFDTTGRLIISKRVNNVDNFSWNLEDSSGTRVPAGMYLYKVSIKTKNSEFTTKANKIIILKE